MKKTTFTLLFATLIAGLVLTGCKSPTVKEKLAQEKLNEAEENLIIVKNAANTEEWEAFKKKTDSVLTENEIQITELKLKMKKAGKSIDAGYEKSIDNLEQKNRDLKAKLSTYKNDADSDWQSFKREFNHDKEELSQALKDLAVNNTK